MPSPAPELVALRQAFETTTANVETLKALRAPAKTLHETLAAAFPAKRLKARLAGDTTELRLLETELAEAKRESESIAADVMLAEAQLREAADALRRFENAAFIKQAKRRVRAYGKRWKEMGALFERAGEIYRDIWMDREELIVGYPGGVQSHYGHPAFVQGALLSEPDILKAISAAFWRCSGKEFLGHVTGADAGADARWEKSKAEWADDWPKYARAHRLAADDEAAKARYLAQHQPKPSVLAARAPAWPGAKPKHLGKTAPKDSPTLAEAADHMVAYLCSILDGRPGAPISNQEDSTDDDAE
jgi:hypothetical protein